MSDWMICAEAGLARLKPGLSQTNRCQPKARLNTNHWSPVRPGDAAGQASDPENPVPGLDYVIDYKECGLTAQANFLQVEIIDPINWRPSATREDSAPCQSHVESPTL